MNKATKLVLPVMSVGMLMQASCSQKAEQSKPNVLLIVSDDQGYADLGCSGYASDVKDSQS